MTDDDRDRYSGPLTDNGVETSNVSTGPLNGRSTEGVPLFAVPDAAWLFATANDALEPQTFDLARLWHELCAGTWRFRDTFSTSERLFAVVERVPVGKQRRVYQRNLEILKRVLLGQVPKVVAAEQGVAISTVATAMQGALRCMGLNGRVSSSPILLTIAARAAASEQLTPTLGRLTRVNANDDKYSLVSVRRPDLQFPVDLSRAEVTVVRQLIAGHTHAEISEQRATSPRTIANQLATAFKKLGVSGRGAVLQRLITHSLQPQSQQA
jgi:DNA-binding CsgD family transcriptional regulator